MGTLFPFPLRGGTGDEWLAEREEAAFFFLRRLGRHLAAQVVCHPDNALMHLALRCVRQERHPRITSAEHRLEVVRDLPVDWFADRLLRLFERDVAVVGADAVHDDPDLVAE